jgi:hypothetical protein
MAGIVTALKAHHHVGARAQPVDNLSLALVAPLGADHRDIGHLVPVIGMLPSLAFCTGAAPVFAYQTPARAPV